MRSRKHILFQYITSLKRIKIYIKIWYIKVTVKLLSYVFILGKRDSVFSLAI